MTAAARGAPVAWAQHGLQREASRTAQPQALFVLWGDLQEAVAALWRLRLPVLPPRGSGTNGRGHVKTSLFIKSPWFLSTVSLPVHAIA